MRKFERLSQASNTSYRYIVDHKVGKAYEVVGHGRNCLYCRASTIQILSLRERVVIYLTSVDRYLPLGSRSTHHHLWMACSDNRYEIVFNLLIDVR